MSAVAPIRLPMEPREGELRVYWGETRDDGADFFAFGPGAVRNYALSHFRHGHFEFEGSFGEKLRLTEQGKLVQQKCFLDQLDEAGYDPKTAIFSIMRKGFTRPKEPAGDEKDAALHEVLEKLLEVRKALDQAGEVKDVAVFDFDEYQGLREGLEEAIATLDAAAI